MDGWIGSAVARRRTMLVLFFLGRMTCGALIYRRIWTNMVREMERFPA
jgi:hypothetical protein